MELRQFPPAAQPQMLVGFELGHAQKIVQHVELVALGELAQARDLLCDEGDRLVGAAFARFVIARAPLRG